MTAKTTIVDGTGSKKEAKVTRDHALRVTQLDAYGFETPDEVLTRYKLYRGFLLDSAGSKNLNVNGSVIPVEFSVSSSPGKILYVTEARVLLNGTYFEMNTNDFRRFGLATVGGGSLTNGITFTASQGGVETLLFAEPIKQSGDFFNYCDDFTNLTNAVSSQSDFLSFDFHFDQPITLPESVSDKLFMTIRDNLTAIELFQVIVRGWQEVG